MGYTTDFDGAFKISPPLSEDHRNYLEAFATTRRMARDAELAARLPDPKREAVGLPIGVDGAYFVGGGGHYGQDRDESILDYNTPPGQPAYGYCYVNRRAATAHERDLIERHSRDKPWMVGFMLDDDGVLHVGGDPCDAEPPHVVEDGHECGRTVLSFGSADQQPGLWCQWTPSRSAARLAWDEGEKFYSYVPWLAYLIGHFLDPWGYTLDGDVTWVGEDPNDRGLIRVRANQITVSEGAVRYDSFVGVPLRTP